MKVPSSVLLFCSFTMIFPGDAQFDMTCISDEAGLKCWLEGTPMSCMPVENGLKCWLDDVQTPNANIEYFYSSLQLTGIVGQSIVFAILKYRNQLFGTKKISDSDLYYPLLFTYIATTFLRFMPICEHSSEVNALGVYKNVLSIIHALNLNYSEKLEVNRIHTVEQKTKVNVKKGSECGICLEGLEGTKVINPCNNKEHLYHDKCLVQWLNRKHSDTENAVYICELCRTDMLPEKVSIQAMDQISAPSFKEITRSFCKSWKGLLVVGLCVLNLYTVVSCNFS